MRTTVTRLLAPPPSRACADGLGYCPRLDALAPLNSRIRGPEPGFEPTLCDSVHAVRATRAFAFWDLQCVTSPVPLSVLSSVRRPNRPHCHPLSHRTNERLTQLTRSQLTAQVFEGPTNSDRPRGLSACAARLRAASRQPTSEHP